MIKAIIVDDEFRARKILQMLVDKHCKEVRVIATAENVDEAEMAIHKHNPDIVFLDIEMPVSNGFQLLERFKNPNFEVIFTTAFEEHAIKAFRYSAIDYLQKPIHYSLLIEAINRYKEKEATKFQKERYELLLQNMYYNVNSFDKLAIASKNGFQVVNVADIVYLEGEGSYSTVYLVSGKEFVSSKHLKELQEMLPATTFYRCHKSYLINLNLCTEYIRSEEQIVMINKGIVPLASRSKKEFIKRLQEQ